MYHSSLDNFADLTIYMTGGNLRDSYTNKCERYDIRKNSWTIGPAMNERRSSHCSCVLGNHVYVFGGYDVEVKNSLERLNAMRDILSHDAQWESMQVSAEAIKPRVNAVFVPVNRNKILVMGGLGDSRISDICAYDLSKK